MISSPAAQEKTRRLDLDRAKGLGIFLVVLGHLAAKTRPQGNNWFGYLQTALYQFHMPFFMYLSGYVCYLSGAARTAPAAWKMLLRRRAMRLLVPFALFGLLLAAGKLIAVRFMNVDNAPASVMQAFLGLVWYTDDSPAISVWYLLVLFVLTIITPPILTASGSRVLPVVMIAGVAYFLPVPHVMYMDRVARFFFFFSIGGAAADLGSRWLNAVDHYAWVCLATLLALLVFVLTEFDSIADRTRLLMCGVASMPALHGLIRQSGLSRSGTLLTLGSMSFTIYLFNTPCIGLAKGLLFKLMSWDGINFLIFFPILLAAGTLGPILIKRKLLPRRLEL